MRNVRLPLDSDVCPENHEKRVYFILFVWEFLFCKLSHLTRQRAAKWRIEKAGICQLHLI